MSNKIEYDKLTFHFKRKDRIPINFKDFNRPLGLIRKIKDGCIDLEKVKENQKKLRKKIWVKQQEENGKKLSYSFMNILQLYPRLNVKQNMVKTYVSQNIKS